MDGQQVSQCTQYIECAKALVEMCLWWPGGGQTARLPLQKASLSDLWPLCLSPLIHHPILSATPSVTRSSAHSGPVDRDWLISLLNFLISKHFQSCCHARQKSFDRIPQPGSLRHHRACFCLFCFILLYDVAVGTKTLGFLETCFFLMLQLHLKFALIQTNFRLTLNLYGQL